MKNREPHRSKPQQNSFLFWPLLLLVLFFLCKQKLICHWIFKVIIFPLSPSSMCAIHFPHEKLGSSSTGGMYLFLNPVKSRHLVGEGEHREEEEGKHNKGRQDPLNMRHNMVTMVTYAKEQTWNGSDVKKDVSLPESNINVEICFKLC